MVSCRQNEGFVDILIGKMKITASSHLALAYILFCPKMLQFYSGNYQLWGVRIAMWNLWNLRFLHACVSYLRFMHVRVKICFY